MVEELCLCRANFRRQGTIDNATLVIGQSFNLSLNRKNIIPAKGHNTIPRLDLY
jgi:hypothetical protein